MQMLLTTLVLLALPAMLAFRSFRDVPAWKQREYGNRNFRWTTIIVASAVFSAGTGLFVNTILNNVIIGMATSIVAYLLIIVSATDFGLMLIPRELSDTAQLASLPIFAAALITGQVQWTGVLMGLGMTAGFFLLARYGKFGGGDLDLFAVFVLTLSWWVNYGAFLIAFGLASVLQLLLLPILKMLNLVHKGPDANYAWDKQSKSYVPTVEAELTVPDDADSIPTAPEEAASAETDDKPLPRKKNRTHVPFGPALIFGYLVVAIAQASGVVEKFFDWYFGISVG